MYNPITNKLKKDLAKEEKEYQNHLEELHYRNFYKLDFKCVGIGAWNTTKEKVGKKLKRLNFI